MSNFWRNVIYLPTVITPVAMITVWTQYVYNNRYGLLKTIFEALGLEKLANIPSTAIICILVKADRICILQYRRKFARLYGGDEKSSENCMRQRLLMGRQMERHFSGLRSR